MGFVLPQKRTVQAPDAATERASGPMLPFRGWKTEAGGSVLALQALPLGDASKRNPPFPKVPRGAAPRPVPRGGCFSADGNDGRGQLAGLRAKNAPAP